MSAADCAAVYEFVLAVWWTTAALNVAAYTGPSRRIGTDSSAPQLARGMIAGCAVSAIRRSGTFETGLETKKARTRETRPDVRYWIAFESAGPDRIADPPAAGGPRLASARVGQVLRLGRGADPPAPAPRDAARADPHRAGALPVDAHDVEVLLGREAGCRSVRIA